MFPLYCHLTRKILNNWKEKDIWEMTLYALFSEILIALEHMTVLQVKKKNSKKFKKKLKFMIFFFFIDSQHCVQPCFDFGAT